MKLSTKKALTKCLTFNSLQWFTTVFWFWHSISLLQQFWYVNRFVARVWHSSLKKSKLKSSSLFSYGKNTLGNFTKFKRKHLCRSLLLKKLEGWSLQVINRDTPTQMFWEFCEIFQNNCYAVNLWPIASEKMNNKKSLVKF